MAKIRENIEEFQPDARLVDERGPTGERLLKAETVDRDGVVCGFYDRGDARRTYTLRDSPIERAYAKKAINKSQYDAAGKFYNHWYRAGLSANFGSIDLNRIFGGGESSAGMARTEAQAFHRQQYRRAVVLIGLLGSSVLELVICQEGTLEDAGRKLLGWNNRPQAVAAATQTLRDRLDILCKDWGIG